ncbi:MAG: DNA polymerase III subunit alpha [Planctomycetes bacterium]|nr:DNA polymerase III subunit alpha [Planctomycetota bacterium]
MNTLLDDFERMSAADLGTAVAQAFAVYPDMPLPCIAAQTHFTLHGGLLSPQLWQDFLEALALEAPFAPRLLLADHADFAALPQCRRRWTDERCVIGAQLHLPDAGLALVLVPNAEAYAHACQLLSLIGEKPQALLDWQAEISAAPDCSGLIVLLNDLVWLRRFREAGAEAYWRSGLRPQQAPDGIASIAAPLCAFVGARDRSLEPVLWALRHRSRVARYHHAEDDYREVVSLSDLITLPENYRQHSEQLQRSAELMQRCQFMPQTDIHYPPCFYDHAQKDLHRLCDIGMRQRYGEIISDTAQARLEHELQVIEGKHFASYILTVFDLAQKRRTCGRGSAASSMVCYVLGLTNVDPIRYSLVFERFLAPEREDPPDIDLDFPWDERDGVFAAALSRYGDDRVAMVSTHLHYRRWSAMRETARVHGHCRDDITAVKHHISQVQRFGGEMHIDQEWQQILSSAELLRGAPRHYGLHPGGLIITEGPIRNIVPLHPSGKIINGKPMPAIAWEKDGAEAMGLLKIDLLGNRSLAVIRDCIDDLRCDGIDIDEKRWAPQDDPLTRRSIARGQTMGCFYIESPAMRQLNAKAGSGDFDRLIIHSSIVRPAANKWINAYLERLHYYQRCGAFKEEWFVHPVLKDLLSQSFGILSYQEDVMTVARELAGFSSREQNFLRKSLGRSDTRERLQEIEGEFRDGCRRRGVNDAVWQHVWSMISSFAGYSFCKAHSASYAMISFQCAYLKAHHPAYFLARVIANEGGYYNRSAYIEEARRLGIQIAGPCVLRSQWLTRRETAMRIRLGLHIVPHLSKGKAQRIMSESRHRGFRSFCECYIRCRLSRRDCETLQEAGALNNILRGYHAAERLWIIKSVCEIYPKVPTVDHPLYEYIQQHGFADPQVPRNPRLMRPDNQAVLRQRYMHLGCLPFQHPLHLWSLPKRHCHCKDISADRHGEHVRIIAWSITRKQVDAVQRRNKNGIELEDPIHQSMSFVTLEDETAVIESIWFPKVYHRYGALLDQTWPLHVHGKIQVDYGFPTLVVDYVGRVESQ